MVPKTIPQRHRCRHRHSALSRTRPVASLPSMLSSQRLLFMLPLLLLVVVVVLQLPLASSAILGRSRREQPNQRSIRIRNMGGRRIDIFWMNTFEEGDEIKLVSQSENEEGYAYGADTAILSYIGHSFRVIEMKGKQSGKCVYDECRTAEFTVTDAEDQEVYINQTFDLIFTDADDRAEQKADKIMDACQAKLLLMEQDDQDQQQDPLAMIDALSECMSQKLHQTFTKEEDDRAFQSQLRTTMGQHITSYACGDAEFESSIEILNRTWHFGEGGDQRQYLLKTFHERSSPSSSSSSSRIMTVPNFVTNTECQTLQSAIQHDIVVPFISVNGKERQGIILHALASKMYELMRVTLGWHELDFIDQYEMGQELFDIVKDKNGLEVPKGKCSAKKKKKKKEKEDDNTVTEEATIDSDGQVVTTTEEEETEEEEDDDFSDAGKTCKLPGAAPIEATTKPFFASDNDLATVLLFCEEPEKSLGGIHFPMAGVHINPEKGTAVVVVHRTREQKEYDGYTQEYHLCPNHNVYKHKFMQKQ